ncbi:outer membrane protein assembly factor BamE [Rhodobacteraceae bacterium]|nr:outer membrane protein assembly factor BamE [Paracoccaceae bacterium]
MRLVSRHRQRAVVALVGLAVLSACSRLEDRTGYIPDAQLLQDVQVGRDTKDTVGRILGRPGTEGIIDENAWYYVRSDYERFLWRAPVEVDRQVLAVSFAEDQRVSNIERFGLEQGQVVVLERRVTDSNTQGVSFLRQLFSNLGNFNPGDFFNDDG